MLCARAASSARWNVRCIAAGGPAREDSAMPATAKHRSEPRGATASLRRAIIPLTGPDGPWDELLHRIGDARFVLLGEATHGTHEFYRARAEITRRLIEERGFAAVAVEADWPDAFRVDRFVRGDRGAPDAENALAGFERFPTWMWRNADVLAFAQWLAKHNATLAPAARVGFHGL